MSGKGTYIGIAVGLSIVAMMLWSYLGRDTAPMFYVSPGAIPPAVRVTLTRSNGPVRAFFGPLHTMLILPDGSLWEWGELGGPSGAKIRVPTRIGTNDDWIEAAVAEGHYLGIRKDGTLWNWGTPYSLSPLVGSPGPVTFPVSPVQAGAESNWGGLAASGMHSAVLRRDGTIWAWGDDSLGEMGNGLEQHETNRMKGHSFVMESNRWTPVYLHEGRTNLVLVGTNDDWAAISPGYGSSTLGLRRNGTLWVWGAIHVWGSATQSVYSVPTQVCQETNWVHIAGEVAINSKGEAWRLFRALPDATASAASIGDFLAAGCKPGRSASGVGEIYQLHEDGTLWAGKLAWSAKEQRLGPAANWHRVGKRSDWISLDGWSGTVIGVTGDGTVWMWGTDISQEGVEMLQSRMSNLKRKALGLLRVAPAFSSSASIMPVQKEPRELFQLTFKLSQEANQPR